MKEIRETKLVEQTTVRFIANDGKEFKTEKECLDHERRTNEEKVRNDFLKIAKEIKTPFLDIYWAETKTWLVSLKTHEDFDKVIDFCVCFDCDLTEEEWEEKRPPCFPCEIVVTHDLERDYCYILQDTLRIIKEIESTLSILKDF